MAESNRLPILAAEIRQAHADVQDAAKTAAQRAIDAGHALTEAKSLVKHGEWLPWLREHCALAERTAQLYMKLARSGLESATVADLGLQAAAKSFMAPYPFPDPFYDGEEFEQREWWMFCLYLRKSCGMRAEGAWNHIYWIRRKAFNTPDEWLTEGAKWVRVWGGRMDERHLERWQSFRAELEDKQLNDVEAELTKLAEAESPEPVRKRRRRRK